LNKKATPAIYHYISIFSPNRDPSVPREASTG
jgi:hypothetical protein